MDALEDGPAAGRVTRSLRKRLTSVDSESSSRPCTPINTKLSSINELNSPSISTRITRRNSITNLTPTPAKAKTPSKTVSLRTPAARPNTPTDSPMRRTTRRRSVSITMEEDEESTVIKSEPQLDVLKEEESSSISNIVEKRVTRSSSKSPQTSNAGGSAKSSPKSSVKAKRSSRPGPKSKSIKISPLLFNNDGNESEVEVINLETELEDTKEKRKDSSHNNDIIEIDGVTSDENIDNTDIEETPQKTKEIEKVDETQNKKNIQASPYKTPTKLKGNKNSIDNKITDKTSTLDTHKNTPIQPKEEKMSNEAEMRETTKQSKSPKITLIRLKENQKLNDIKTQSTINEYQATSITEADYDHKLVEHGVQSLIEPENDNSVLIASPNVGIVDSSVESQMKIVHGELRTSPKKRSSDALVIEVIKLESIPSDEIAELTNSNKKAPTYIEGGKNNETPEKLKSVAFNEYLQEDVAKTMYPRTPASNKRKTFYAEYINSDANDTSFQTTIAGGNNDSFSAAEMENAVSIPEEKPSIQELTESSKTPTKSMTVLKVASPKEGAAVMVCDNAAGFFDNEQLVKNEDKSLLPMPVKAFETPKRIFEATSGSSEASHKNRKSSDTTIDHLKCSEKLQSFNILSKSVEALEIAPEGEAINKLPVKSPSGEDILPSTKLRTPKKIKIEKSPQTAEKLLSQAPSDKLQTQSTESLLPQKNTEITQFPKTSIESAEKVDSSEETKVSQTFALSWTQNVTRMANTNNKIDVIISEKEKTPNAQIKGRSPKRHSRFESDDDERDLNERYESKEEEEAEVENIQNEFEADDEEVCNLEDEEEFVELDEHEKPYKKCAFVSNEAEEADDDYQSGDSMDSEERRDLEANEILDEGHSIGSEDTDEDEERDDDKDEDTDSFIANDSEEIEQEEESDNNDHLLEVERKNRRNLKNREYKRILLVEDSDSEKQTEESDSEHPEEFQPLTLDDSKMVDDSTSKIEDTALKNSENNTATHKKFESVDTFDYNDEGTIVETHMMAKMYGCQKIKDESITSVREKRKSLRKSIAEVKKEVKSIMNKAKLVDGENTDELSENDGSADVRATDKDYGNSNKDESYTNQKGRDSKGDYKSNNDSNLIEENALAEDEIVSEIPFETALNLKVCDSDESSKDQQDDLQEQEEQQIELNASRKEIKNLQQSVCFNMTVHDFRENSNESTSGDAEPKANTTASRRATSLGGIRISKLRPLRKSMPQHHRSKKAVAACELSSSEDEFQKIMPKEKIQKKSFGDKNLNRSSELVSSDESSATSGVEATHEAYQSSEPNKSFNSSKENNTVKNEESLLGKVSINNNGIDSDLDLSKCKESRSATALSVSVANIKEQMETTKGAKLAHSSFTIEVSVNKRARGDTPEPVETSFSDEAVENNKNQEEDYSTPDSDTAVFSSAEEDEEIEKLQVNSDEKLLEKLQMNSKTHTSSAGRRKSLVTPKDTSKENSDKVGTEMNSLKRRTLCIPADYGDFTTSQSFIESVAERKRDIVENQSKKRKRLSKSFCNGTVAGSLDTTDLEEVYHLHKKSKLARNNNAINSSTPVASEKVTTKNDDNNNRHQKMLGRCEEILEAANRAKLEAKQNYNKSKVKVPKMKKSQKIQKVAEPLNTKDEEEFIQKQKQIKRKEHAKMEIEKALKASADLLLNRPQKQLNIDNQRNNSNLESKLLPSYQLEDFTGAESVTHKKKKSKPDPENLQNIHILKSSAGDVVEMPLVEKKKKNHTTEIQLSTGIVRVEPVTPKKSRIQNGFRESPITPRGLGFKVRHILTAGQDTPPSMPTRKERLKRKRNNEEPSQKLPKPQWTQSGAFIEEDLYPSLCSGSKQFLVRALNGARQAKKSALEATSAHQFKNNALFNSNIPRESSRDLLLKKQRQHVQSHY